MYKRSCRCWHVLSPSLDGGIFGWAIEFRIKRGLTSLQMSKKQESDRTKADCTKVHRIALSHSLLKSTTKTRSICIEQVERERIFPLSEMWIVLAQYNDESASIRKWIVLCLATKQNTNLVTGDGSFSHNNNTVSFPFQTAKPLNYFQYPNLQQDHREHAAGLQRPSQEAIHIWTLKEAEISMYVPFSSS